MEGVSKKKAVKGKGTEPSPVANLLAAYKASCRAQGVRPLPALVTAMEDALEDAKFEKVVLHESSVDGAALHCVAAALSSYPLLKNLCCWRTNIGDRGLFIISQLIAAGADPWTHGPALRLVEVCNDGAGTDRRAPQTGANTALEGLAALITTSRSPDPLRSPESSPSRSCTTAASLQQLRASLAAARPLSPPASGPASPASAAAGAAPGSPVAPGSPGPGSATSGSVVGGSASIARRSSGLSPLANIARQSSITNSRSPPRAYHPATSPAHHPRPQDPWANGDVDVPWPPEPPHGEEPPGGALLVTSRPPPPPAFSVEALSRLGAAVGLPRCTLRELSLDHNDIGDDGLAALAPGLGRCPSLERLSLSFNSITEVGAAHIGRLLDPGASTCHLSHLRLQGNLLAGAGVTCLARAAATSSSLVSLCLADTRVGPLDTDAVTELCHFVRTAPALHRLDLRFNDIGSAHASALLHVMQDKPVVIVQVTERIDRDLAVKFATLHSERSPKKKKSGKK